MQSTRGNHYLQRLMDDAIGAGGAGPAQEALPGRVPAGLVDQPSGPADVRRAPMPVIAFDTAGGNHPDGPSIGGLIAREEAPAKPAGKTVINDPVRRTYPVSGKTLAAAVKVVEAYVAQTGEAAKTHWAPGLKYDKDDDGNVKNPVVTINISVTMPNWPGVAKLSAAAQAEWNRAIAELGAHEDKHVAIVKEKMAGVGEALAGLTPGEADAQFKQALADLQTSSDAIDPFDVVVDVDIK
jgi:predicted secreted Zn-dependent protease